MRWRLATISIICCSKARWSLLAACLSRCPSMRLLHRTYEPCFNFLSCSFFVRISRRAHGVEWIDDETIKWTDFERRCFRCSTSRKRTRKMMLQPSGDSRMSDVVMYGISRNLQVPGYRPPVAISHQHDTLLFLSICQKTNKEKTVSWCRPSWMHFPSHQTHVGVRGVSGLSARDTLAPFQHSTKHIHVAYQLVLCTDRGAFLKFF